MSMAPTTDSVAQAITDSIRYGMISRIENPSPQDVEDLEFLCEGTKLSPRGREFWGDDDQSGATWRVHLPPADPDPE